MENEQEHFEYGETKIPIVEHFAEGGETLLELMREMLAFEAASASKNLYK